MGAWNRELSWSDRKDVSPLHKVSHPISQLVLTRMFLRFWAQDFRIIKFFFPYLGTTGYQLDVAQPLVSDLSLILFPFWLILSSSFIDASLPSLPQFLYIRDKIQNPILCPRRRMLNASEMWRRKMSGWPGHTRLHWIFFLKTEGGEAEKMKEVNGTKGAKGAKKGKGAKGVKGTTSWVFSALLSLSFKNGFWFHIEYHTIINKYFCVYYVVWNVFGDFFRSLASTYFTLDFMLFALSPVMYVLCGPFWGRTIQASYFQVWMKTSKTGQGVSGLPRCWLTFYVQSLYIRYIR